MPLRPLLLVVVLVLTVWARPGRAATYDPDLTWRTIVTDHFRIHFHQGLEPLAEQFSHMVERVYGEMRQEMSWRMRMRTDVVLIDRTDNANGFATAVPYNSITIFVTAPQEDSTLSLYEDWNELIFTHELTHVLHLETNGGIVRAARAVLGRIASTNDVSPPWMVEGLATFQETRQTPGGRGRSPYVDMIKRSAVVHATWPPLGNLDGIQADLPAGNLRYLFGEDFMSWIADHTGDNVWTRWTHAYGRSIPYLLPSKKVFGRTLQRLYRDWKQDRTAAYEAQLSRIKADGVREGRAISKDRSSCTAPAFSPDDRWLIWSCWDPRTGNALWRSEADGSGAEIYRQDIGAKTFTWRRDGKAFAYAATHIVNRFNLWSDVYLHELGTGRTRAITTGARARDPDFSPDGERLVVVTNRSANTRLEVITVDQKRTALTPRSHTGTQFATPRHAPSGRAVAVSIWEDARRDLWLVSPQGERLRRLTADVPSDRDPAWSPDGRTLYFVSDRTGVPNVFAIDIETERLWQVTNVRTGAGKPSVNADGTRLAFELYAWDGFEIRLLDVDRATWADRGVLAAPLDGGPSLAELVLGPSPDAGDLTAWDAVGRPVDLAAPASGAPAGRAARQDTGIPGTFEQVEIEDAFGEEQDYPFTFEPRRYNPLPAMVPRWWLPVLSTTPRLPGPPPNPVSRFFDELPPPFVLGGFEVTATTGTTDPLRHYSYQLALSYRSDANDLGGGFTFTVNRWLPVFSFGASTGIAPRVYLVTGPWQPVNADGDPVGFTAADQRTFFMRSVNGFVSFSYPYSPRSTVFANYRFTWRTPRDTIDPFAVTRTIPLRGTLGNLTAGYRYSWSQPTAYAISPEDARAVTLAGTLTAPFLGAFAQLDDGGREELWQLLLSVDWREFLVNPLAPNHVFALRAGAGIAFGGDDQFLGNFAVGGNGLGAARALRGYPFSAAIGDSYWLIGAEYRLPLWRIDRGFGTFPVFFRFLSAHIYAEAGNAFDSVQDLVDALDDTLVGVGAELRLNTFVLWGGTLDARLGYAVGLTQDGYWFDDPRTLYFLLSANL